MKLITTATSLSLLASSVVAFAPSATTRASVTSALHALDIDSVFGVTIETGNKCPPLGAKLLEDTDERALKWFQNAEIKNGRVAMVAAIGYVSDGLPENDLNTEIERRA
jgi:hypothetical protein